MENKDAQIMKDDKKRDASEIVKLACFIQSVGGTEPTEETKKIVHAFTAGEIDYETAFAMLTEKYKK